MAMGLLFIHYVKYISSYSPWLMKRIAKYKTCIVFGFPIITALPFTTPDNSYGVTDSIFCGLPSNSATQDLWAIFILHFWLWIVLIISISLLCRTLYNAFKHDANIAGKIITTIGIYVFVKMLAWLERTIPRVMNLLDPGFHSPPITYLVMIYILYSIAIIYGVLLVRDKMVVLVDYQTMGNKHRDGSVVDDVSN